MGDSLPDRMEEVERRLDSLAHGHEMMGEEMDGEIARRLRLEDRLQRVEGHVTYINEAAGPRTWEAVQDLKDRVKALERDSHSQHYGFGCTDALTPSSGEGEPEMPEIVHNIASHLERNGWPERKRALLQAVRRLVEAREHLRARIRELQTALHATAEQRDEAKRERDRLRQEVERLRKDMDRIYDLTTEHPEGEHDNPEVAAALDDAVSEIQGIARPYVKDQPPENGGGEPEYGRSRIAEVREQEESEPSEDAPGNVSDGTSALDSGSATQAGLDAPVEKITRNESTPEARRIWQDVDRAAERAPSRVWERLRSEDAPGSEGDLTVAYMAGLERGRDMGPRKPTEAPEGEDPWAITDDDLEEAWKRGDQATKDPSRVTAEFIRDRLRSRIERHYRPRRVTEEEWETLVKHTATPRASAHVLGLHLPGEEGR